MKEGFDEGFGARLRELLGNDSVNAFAKRCEVPEASMRAYLEGKVPTADRAFRIAQKADADFEWLVAGVMAGVARNTITRAPDRNDLDIVATGDGMTFAVEMKGQISPEFALVPRLDIEASAGDGRLAETEDPLEYLAFQRGWLKARGINPERARILTARGDSMEETIRDGDVLLIDTSIDRIRDNAIYIVVYGDMVLVKRVHGRINGSLQLISDNPRYPPEEVTAAEVDQLNIAGRVMWFGRTI